jgi:hypothetical protein
MAMPCGSPTRPAAISCAGKAISLFQSFPAHGNAPWVWEGGTPYV